MNHSGDSFVTDWSWFAWRMCDRKIVNVMASPETLSTPSKLAKLPKSRAPQVQHSNPFTDNEHVDLSRAHAFLELQS